MSSNSLEVLSLRALSNFLSKAFFFSMLPLSCSPSSVMYFNLFYSIFSTLNVHLEMIDGDFHDGKRKKFARMFPFKRLISIVISLLQSMLPDQTTRRSCFYVTLMSLRLSTTCHLSFHVTLKNEQQQ